MPIRVGICDDQAEDIRTLAEALYAYDPAFQIITYSSGAALLMDCSDDQACSTGVAPRCGIKTAPDPAVG